jgi:AcrR family transcriptional regulator
MSTKSHILQVAIELFNSSGTAAISTNHIAAAAQISPGNLYYHYRNKEEIIRAIAEQMIKNWGEIWHKATLVDRTIENIKSTIKQNFGILVTYRFFFRELIPLLEHDPTLKQRYQSIRLQRTEELQMLLLQYAADGILRQPENPEDFRMLITASMLVNNQWLIEAELETGSMTQEHITKGVDLLMFLWRPYL